MQRLWVLEHRAHGLERTAQVVEDREVDEVRAVALGQVVIEHLESLDPARSRTRGKRLRRQRFVVRAARADLEREHQRRHLVELREDLVHQRRDRGAVAREPHRLLGEDACLDCRIAQARGPLGQRQRGKLLVGRHRHEDIEAGVEAVHHANRAAAGLQANVQAVGLRGLRALRQPLPLRRRIDALEPGQRERPPGPAGHGFEQVVLGVEARPLAGGIAAHAVEVAHCVHYAVRQSVIGARQFDELLLRGNRSRRVLALGSAVVVRAPGGKPRRARLQGLAQQLAHALEVVRRGGLEVRGTVAHHEKAQAVVRHQRHEIEAMPHGVEHIRVIGEALPAPAHALGQHRAGNLLHAFHQLHQARFLAFLHRRKPHAAVAHHHRGDAVVDARAEGLVPRGLPVVVGVDVDEPRRDDGAGRVDGFLRNGGDLADLLDLAVPNADVGRLPRRARAVVNRPAANHQVKHLQAPLYRGAATTWPAPRPTRCARCPTGPPPPPWRGPS